MRIEKQRRRRQIRDSEKPRRAPIYIFAPGHRNLRNGADHCHRRKTRAEPRKMRNNLMMSLYCNFRAPPPIGLHHRLYHGDPGASYGLQSALAARGVIVEGKFHLNLNTFELMQKGATITESLPALPIHVRGTVPGECPEISKAQFSKLLKQVTSHLSSISNIFIHDGAVGSSSRCSAKIRVISDSPSATLSLSNILCPASTRAVSHDTCPVTTYVASSISTEAIGSAIGLGSQGSMGFLAADTERSSLILCGKAFADSNGVKRSLAALSEPILAARGGIPLKAWILELGELVVLLFAPEDVIQSSSDLLMSVDPGVIFAPQGVAPFFQTKNPSTNTPCFYKLPDAVILACSDGSGVLPAISKLSPGQAAFHFLAGYQNGKYIPAFNSGPSCIDPLELSKALYAKLKDNSMTPLLININDGEKRITGKDLVELVQSNLSKDISYFQPKGKNLKQSFKRYLLSKYQELPEEFSF